MEKRLSGWKRELLRAHGLIADLFVRSEPRALSLAYLQGLLSGCERKNRLGRIPASRPCITKRARASSYIEMREVEKAAKVSDSPFAHAADMRTANAYQQIAKGTLRRYRQNFATTLQSIPQIPTCAVG